ncbi:haloacid dehalogenase [Gymnopilus junonius]|uniref:Haloacid dehalogenase n=1 Tax=Gymnopilus junonius TaxID=109634 RepID=A0A9P5NTQ8_GYMJU|nr:haloacid dehalogenase [Gymnopilus junonius]
MSGLGRKASVISELEDLAQKHGLQPGSDWEQFGEEWRQLFLKNAGHIAAGPNSNSMESMHRKANKFFSFKIILDDLLGSPDWSHAGAVLGDAERDYLCQIFHRLKGWPDAVEGLHALKKQVIIAALSNGNLRQLIDTSKYAGLPWDMIFSAEFFNTYKPNPKAYTEAVRHLALPAESCGMVSAHIGDLRAAAGTGMKTIYVRRPNEDAFRSGEDDEVKSKAGGGEVDYVVDSLVQLADVLVTSDKGDAKK